MQNELTLLRRLQDVDLEIEETLDKADHLSASLEEIGELHGALSGSLEAQKEELEATRKLMRAKSVEVDENRQRFNEAKARHNKASNSKELGAIEKEIETLSKMNAQFEEELEQLRDAVTDAEADVAEKEEKTNELAAEMKRQQQVVDKESSAAEKRVKELEKERERIKDEFGDARSLVRTYDFIRRRMSGRVIVPARDGACSGCNMVVPPQMYNELMVGEQVKQCPSCKRILYYEATESPEDDD